MFYWKSKALERYGTGYIIVDYKDIEIARVRALDAFEEWLKENRDWLFLSQDEDDVKQLNDLRKQFRDDIYLNLPEQHLCMLIQGTE